MEEEKHEPLNLFMALSLVIEWIFNIIGYDAIIKLFSKHLVNEIIKKILRFRFLLIKCT